MKIPHKNSKEVQFLRKIKIPLFEKNKKKIKI
jgi:hypothetical protein